MISHVKEEERHINPIPLVDLKAQYQTIKQEVDTAIKRVLLSTDFILGQKVEQFEKEFAKFCQVKFAVGVASGLNALELGMRAYGISPGDEVITPVNSFIASSSAISLIGARPVLVDCDEQTYNIDPQKIEEKISKKTKAIMPVHLYGRPAEMDAILKTGKKYHLIVVEDACQSPGATFKGQTVGSIGNLGAFSFYPGKNLGAYGDGGMLTTNDQKLARQVSQMRNYGQTTKYHHQYLAWNSRLDTIQAAVLLTKLKYLKIWNQARAKIAQIYNKLLSDLPIITPDIPTDAEHVFHLYIIRTPKRDDLSTYLNKKGISTGIHYPIPIHLQPIYKDLGYKKGDFPVAEKLAAEILSLPIYPELKSSQVEYIAKTIKDFFKKI